MAGVGSKPGEHRGGRKKGTPNKATRDIKALAQKHGIEAIEKLVKLMRGQDKRAEALGAKILKVRADDPKAESLIQQLAVLLSARNIPAEITATKELLDRGYGKPAQVVTGNEDGPAISVIHRVIVGLPVPEQPEIADVLEGECNLINDENTTHDATHDEKREADPNKIK